MKSTMFFVLFFAVCFSLTAQISIDYSDIPMNVGLSWETYSIDSATVNVGTLGGPQTWNFSGFSSTDLDYHKLVLPSSAPSFSLFPASTKVEFIQDEQGGSDSMFAYYEIIPAYFKVLGWELIDGSIHIVWPIENFQFFFPLNYLDSASFYSYDTIFDSGPILTIMEYRSRAIVDAWGTLIISAGSYQTLRVRQMVNEITRTYFNGVPVVDDTTCYIMYSWLAENMPELLDIGSSDGDTNLYFTLADNIELFAGYTGVEELPAEKVGSSCFLRRGQGNYILVFENLENSVFELIDISGRKIREHRVSGAGSLNIDTESPGIFFVRVRGKNIDFWGKINSF